MIDIDIVLKDIRIIKDYINNIVEYNLDIPLTLEDLVGFLNRLNNLYHILRNMIADEIDIDELLDLMDNEDLGDFSDMVYELNISDRLSLTTYL